MRRQVAFSDSFPVQKCVISSTFGPTPKKPDPSQFLRKAQSLPKSSNKFRRSTASQKTPVPSCDDKPIMGLRTSKNYIVSNATQAIIQEPKIVNREEESFLEKETYGKVPEYLNKVKQDISREKEIVDRCVKEQTIYTQEGQDPEYEIMNEEERQKLIWSLKKKWDEVNSTYQKIFSIDSLGDLKRKEAQEAELQQLEDDINRLGRPGPLFIRK